MHTRFDFTLEGCANDEALNSHGDLPLCSLSDSFLESGLSGKLVFLNPHLKLAKMMACQFESYWRTSLTSTMDVFALPKWANLNDLTRLLKLYQDLSEMKPLYTLVMKNDISIVSTMRSLLPLQRGR
jgi:hypothetical protein